jgi:hypothetical protein
MEIIVKKRSDDRPSRQKKQIVLEVAPYWSGYPKIEKDDPLRTENAPAEWSFRCRAAEPVGHATFLRAARRIGRSFCTVFHAFSRRRTGRKLREVPLGRGRRSRTRRIGLGRRLQWPVALASLADTGCQFRRAKGSRARPRRAMVVVKRWVRLMLVRSHAFSRLPIFRCTVMTVRPSFPIAILPGVVAELGRVL